MFFRGFGSQCSNPVARVGPIRTPLMIRGLAIAIDIGKSQLANKTRAFFFASPRVRFPTLGKRWADGIGAILLQP